MISPTSSSVAAAVLGELIGRGIRDVVVCPGSRSQALAFAAEEAERLGAIRLHVRVDERSAAFFALGIGRETGIPAVVITTSGTAVANLLPATLEAFHARVPLILLTAERPEELRGVRANQTVQRGEVLGGYTRWSADVPAAESPAEGAVPDGSADPTHSARVAAARAACAAAGEIPGPVHLNIAFRDPLSGGPPLMEREISRGATADAELPTAAEPEGEVYKHGADGNPLAVVIAGADAGAEAADFAREAGLPILAEPSSGARFGREAIQHWQQLLADSEHGGAIERVVVFGHPTITREVPALIHREGVDTVVIDAAGPNSGVERFNPGRRAKFARAAVVAKGYEAAQLKPWLGKWVVSDRALRAQLTTMHEPDLEAARSTGYKERNAFARAEVASMREPVTREHLTEAVWLASWPHDRLVVAASRLIRVLNRTAAPRNIPVYANRGLSGIDGTIATALGIAVASQANADPAKAAGVTRVLLGDLALLHDVGSLLLPPAEGTAGVTAEPRPRIQLFVANDGGGSIFDMLEAATTADRDAFDRVMYTPQRVDIRALAEAYGWEYQLISTQGELDRLLTVPVEGPSLVEVNIER